MTPSPAQTEPRGHPHLLCAFCALCLGLAGGCQLPPAAPVTEVGGRGQFPHGFVLARQVACDSALSAVTRPAETAARAVCGTASVLCTAGTDLVSKRLLLPLAGAPLPLDAGRPFLDPACLEERLGHVCRGELRPASVRLEIDGAEAFRSLEQLIGSARGSIDILMYLWDSDPAGWALARLVADRAAALRSRETPVRVLVDGGGALVHSPPRGVGCGGVNEAVAWLARQPNVKVFRTRIPLARLDHRKLVIVDGHTAWSGGRNFTVSSFFHNHDLSYTLRGPLVSEIADSFERAWARAGGEPRPCPPPTPAKGCNALARVVATGTCRRDLARALYAAVDHARHHVYLENPYFADNLLLCKLAEARRRGADVRVMLARESQSKVLDRATRVTVNRLLGAGVRVYFHPEMTHVKAVSVDGRWAYVGTGNFDNLSLRRNWEVGLSISAGPVLEELERRLFLTDFRPEWEITEPLLLTAGDYLCEVLANLLL